MWEHFFNDLCCHLVLHRKSNELDTSHLLPSTGVRVAVTQGYVSWEVHVRPSAEHRHEPCSICTIDCLCASSGYVTFTCAHFCLSAVDTASYGQKLIDAPSENAAVQKKQQLNNNMQLYPGPPPLKVLGHHTGTAVASGVAHTGSRGQRYWTGGRWHRCRFSVRTTETAAPSHPCQSSSLWRTVLSQTAALREGLIDNGITGCGPAAPNVQIRQGPFSGVWWEQSAWFVKLVTYRTQAGSLLTNLQLIGIKSLGNNHSLLPPPVCVSVSDPMRSLHILSFWRRLVMKWSIHCLSYTSLETHTLLIDTLFFLAVREISLSDKTKYCIIETNTVYLSLFRSKVTALLFCQNECFQSRGRWTAGGRFISSLILHRKG